MIVSLKLSFHRGTAQMKQKQHQTNAIYLHKFGAKKGRMENNPTNTLPSTEKRNDEKTVYSILSALCSNSCDHINDRNEKK